MFHEGGGCGAVLEQIPRMVSSGLRQTGKIPAVEALKPAF